MLDITASNNATENSGHTMNLKAHAQMFIDYWMSIVYNTYMAVYSHVHTYSGHAREVLLKHT